MVIKFENYGAFYLTLNYAMGYSVDYYNRFTPHSLQDCMEFIQYRMDIDHTITGAILCDWNTGEVVATVERENEDLFDDEPSGIDDDCGFDPYLGCYTDDC